MTDDCEFGSQLIHIKCDRPGINAVSSIRLKKSLFTFALVPAYVFFFGGGGLEGGEGRGIGDNANATG